MDQEKSTARTEARASDPLVAGKDVDGHIAERVFGLTYQQSAGGPFGWYRGNQWVSDFWDLPEYSTDIRAAWEIVAKINDWRWVIERDADGRWAVMLDTHGYFTVATASTAPLAICTAALEISGK